jgi:hypothetical protein
MLGLIKTEQKGNPKMSTKTITSPKREIAPVGLNGKHEEQLLVNLPKLDLRTMKISLVGDSSLLCNRFSEKAKQQMLDKQMKKAKQGKEAKDPEQCFRDSLYHLPGEKFGFPTIAFKGAAVDACTHVDGITKVEARGAFHVLGEYAEIKGKPQPHTATVRIGMGTTDIRIRGEFPEWSTELTVRYNANTLQPEQIINLFNVAGFAIGVGEHRPQKDGSNGMFHVA